MCASPGADGLMTDEPVQAIAGALFGVAVGDAIGSTYEGLMPGWPAAVSSLCRKVRSLMIR